jgi:isoleucyl-tRNA synthetase
MNENKLSAYQTLYECLVTISRLLSPFAPYLAEELYQNLNSVTGKEPFESVHLSFILEAGFRDEILEEKMEIAQKVVYLTRAMRAKSNLKVRQPLKKIMVVVDKSKRDALKYMRDVILEEVNIKELVVLDDDSEIVSKSAKANFKSIGPKFGKKVKVVAEAIKSFNRDEILRIEKGNDIALNINGEEIIISSSDVEIVSTEITGWVVESESGITVAIDTELDDKLFAEGLAREFVNRIQNMRKDAGFDVTDRIKVIYNGSPKLVEAIVNFHNYISNETLAENLSAGDGLNGGYKQAWKIGEFDCSIQIEKISS